MTGIDLNPIKALIEDRLGLRFQEHNEAQLRTAVQRRMQTHGLTSLPVYLSRLHSQDNEWQTLTNLLTINETYFYREAHHLRLLTERLVPGYLHPRQRQVRILSVGCASGEEPYSILMALCEALGEAALERFSVAACDVDTQALATAQAGVYRRLSFRTFPEDLRQRYFQAQGLGEWRIEARLRQAVTFQPLNLLAPSYPPRLAGQDLIFYRNLSIYFDVPTRTMVLKRLRDLLVDTGHLIVGTAETMANDLGILTLCETAGVFYFAKTANHTTRERPVSIPGLPPATDLDTKAIPPGQRLPTALGKARPEPPPVMPRNVPPAKTPAPSEPDPENGEAIYRTVLAQIKAEQLDAAWERLEAFCQTHPEAVRHLTLLAELRLERRDRCGAASAAAQVLELDPWSVEALFLQARLAYLRGDTERAIALARQAVYTRADYWPAHHKLGDWYRETGATELAIREYRLTLRQLAQPAAAQYQNPLPQPFSLHDLQKLCQIQIDRLAAQA